MFFNDGLLVVIIFDLYFDQWFYYFFDGGFFIDIFLFVVFVRVFDWVFVV